MLYLAVRLRGIPDTALVECGLNELLKRHSALRLAVFRNLSLGPAERERRLEDAARTGIFEPGLYLQSVVPVPLPFRLDTCEGEAADAGLRRVIEEQSTCSFEKPPLIRASLFRGGRAGCLLFLAFDHIGVDGWSLQIVRRELESILAPRSDRNTRCDRHSLVTFADFAVWQAQALRTSYFDRSIAYWRTQWARYGAARIGFDELPFSLAAPKKPVYEFGTELLGLDAAQSEVMRQFAMVERVSIHMVFLASYVLLLRYYTRKEQIAIWGHFHNRRPEFRSVIGCFTNTHLIGIDLPSDISGRDLLQQVRRAVLNAYEHQELPLPHFWRVLRCHPRFPDANLLLDYRQTTPPSRLGSLEISEVRLPAISSPRWSSLGVYVVDNGREMWLRSQYSRARYPQAPVQHLLEDLRTVLFKLIRQPDAKVSEFADVAGRYLSKHPRRDASMADFVVVGSDLIPVVA